MVLFAAVPVIVSAIALLFLLTSDLARPPWKLVAGGIFALAAYLQFGTRHALAGLLLQIALGLTLLVWQRVNPGL